MEFINANRWPEEMSTHSPPDPALPGGVHHKLAANAYAERDGRRNVAPPLGDFSVHFGKTVLDRHISLPKSGV